MQPLRHVGRRGMESGLLGKAVLLAALGITAYRDWKEQNVYLHMPLLTGAAGVLLHLLYQKNSIADLLLGVGLGGVIVLLAWGSSGEVGIGDGMMLMASGTFLGAWGNLELFLTALFLAGTAALFLVTVKRKERDYRMPFLPFLLAAYLLQLL